MALTAFQWWTALKLKGLKENRHVWLLSHWLIWQQEAAVQWWDLWDSSVLGGDLFCQLWPSWGEIWASSMFGDSPSTQCVTWRVKAQRPSASSWQHPAGTTAIATTTGVKWQDSVTGRTSGLVGALRVKPVQEPKATPPFMAVGLCKAKEKPEKTEMWVYSRSAGHRSCTTWANLVWMDPQQGDMSRMDWPQKKGAAADVLLADWWEACGPWETGRR